VVFANAEETNAARPKRTIRQMRIWIF
jgi:hypothetical protein